MSDMPIRRMLDLSTAHLPQQVCAKLPGYAGVIAYPLSTADDHYGWLLWVPVDPDAEAAAHDGEIPAEVVAVQRYARALGCDYVLLDRDAERIDDLPTWAW